MGRMKETNLNPLRYMKPNCYALAVLTVCSLVAECPLIPKALGDDWPTDTTLAVTPSPVNIGGTITFISRTSGTLGKGGTVVTYFIGTNQVGSATVASDGTATVTLKTPTISGTYTAKATYSGY